MKITCWEKITKDGPEHNHIEDGWSKDKYPQPKNPLFSLQKSWKGMKWKKVHAFLKDNKITERCPNGKGALC